MRSVYCVTYDSENYVKTFGGLSAPRSSHQHHPTRTPLRKLQYVNVGGGGRVSTLQNEWPSLEAGYQDQFGPIDPKVYQAAGVIWPKAATFGDFALHDRSMVFSIMLKAVARVSKAIATGQNVENLRAYLLRTFKNLVVFERAKALGRTESLSEVPEVAVDVVADLERKILLREIFRDLNNKERTLVLHSMMGYSYEEIARRLELNPATVRQRMHRLTERLRKTFENSDVR